MEMQVKVFGQQAKQIQKGDFFVPEFANIEGRDVVTLVKDNSLKDLLEKYDNSAVGLDKIINCLRDLIGGTQNGS